MTELSDRFINLRLAARLKTTLSGYVEYNLQILGISSDDSDQVALVAEDYTPFSREVSLTIGTKTEDSILKALKGREMDMLDSVWKRVKNHRSLSKLQEVGIGRLWFMWPTSLAKNLLSSKLIHITQTKEWKTFSN